MKKIWYSEYNVLLTSKDTRAQKLGNHKLQWHILSPILFRIARSVPKMEKQLSAFQVSIIWSPSNHLECTYNLRIPKKISTDNGHYYMGSVSAHKLIFPWHNQCFSTSTLTLQCALNEGIPHFSRIIKLDAKVHVFRCAHLFWKNSNSNSLSCQQLWNF